MGAEIEATTRLLKNKYDLHNAPEVQKAVARHRALTRKHPPLDLLENPEGQRTVEKHSTLKGEPPLDPLDSIQIYLDRFTRIINKEDPEKRERVIRTVKQLLHKKYIVKFDEIPDAYWDAQERTAIERGQGGDLARINKEEVKRLTAETLIKGQRDSLDIWIDYLTSPDALYPSSLKYWVIRNVVSMGEFDQEHQKFPQRSKGTVKPFPELNVEALAYVLDAIDKKYRGENIDLSSIPEHKRRQLHDLLQTENFPRLYVWALEKASPVTQRDLTIIDGKWEKYDQGSDPLPLVNSLQGYSTGWCTAAESMARIQLKGGDFYVYYSNAADGDPTIPRVAIRMEGSRIAEVRGRDSGQNLDKYILPKVEEKLDTFPYGEGEVYHKRIAHMEQLTQIDHKTQKGIDLDKDDLTFLYEMHNTIEGFGNSRDPRIDEIKGKRNVKEDLATIYDLEPSQIATNSAEITPTTKIYIGDFIESDIFYKLDEISPEHIFYRTFPSGEVTSQDLAYLRQILKIEFATRENVPLDKEILAFLYDIRESLEHDELLSELQSELQSRKFDIRDKRNLREDLAVLLDKDLFQIATTREEITPDTKIYVGEIVPEMFSQLSGTHIEHVYKHFPREELGEQKLADMNHITQIEFCTQHGIPLTSFDLTFLYERGTFIQPIGKIRDPRIDEIKGKRNVKEDVATIYDLEPSQIATNSTEITSHTKIYIGDVTEEGIFSKLANLDHIFTSFPRREITIKRISAGSTTREQVERQLEEAGIEVSYRAHAAMSSLELSSLQDATIVLLSAKDLGLANASYKDVIQKAHELGLQDCQRGIGPLLRLAYQGQPFYQDIYIITQEGYYNEQSFGLKNNYSGLSLTAPEESFLDRELTHLDARTEFAFVIPRED